MILRSKKMLSAAKDQSCVNCGVEDGTVVAAHYSGLRGHTFGKGKGIKPHDLCVADLCMKCHSAFDNYTFLDGNLFQAKIDQSEQFLYLIMTTLIRRIEQGVIEIGDLK
jgi:hypothetical protein